MDEKDIFEMFDYVADDDKNNGSGAESGGQYISPAESLNTEYIGRFIEENFCEDNPHVFNELLSQTVHLDVFCVPPSEDRDYGILLTSGMSDLPMNTDNNEDSRAELMMLLPEEWNINSTASTLWNWPMQYLKKAARYPHINKTSVSCCGDMNFNEPFAENTGFCALVFVRPTEEALRVICGSDGMKINVYVAVPIYKEELEFKAEHGAQALIEKIYGTEEIPLSGYVVDINRKNSCI